MPKGFYIRKPLRNLEGQQFGRWSVLKFDKFETNRGARWICRCTCGTEKSVVGIELLRKESKSCGCLKVEVTIKQATKHGMHKTAEYSCYCSMKERCLNPKSDVYKYYGGRGIKVCDRWLGDNGFKQFVEDMGMKPSPKLTLERVDNDGNYEPGNCKWATWSEQLKNRRMNKRRATNASR